MKPTTLMLAAVALSATACYLASSAAAVEACGVTIPLACPSSNPPSYASDVAPILSTYCTTCHNPNGQESSKPLDSYTGVSSLASSVESQISTCSMPLSGNPQPSASDRDVVVAWIVCGAQNN